MSVRLTYAGGAFCGERHGYAASQIKVRSVRDGQTRDVLKDDTNQNLRLLSWHPVLPQLLFTIPVPIGGYSYPFTYQADAGQSSQLSTRVPVVNQNAVWSADGLRLALQRPRTQTFAKSAVAVLTLATGELKLPLSLELSQDVRGIDWWPDQSGLLISLRNEPGQSSLQRLGLNGGLEVIWQPESRPEPQEILSFRFSPDGKQLAWVLQRLALNANQSGVYPQQLLYLADISPAGVLTRVRQLVGLQRVGEAFAWSPDSLYLAVSEGTLQFQEPDSEDLFRVDTRTDSLLRLTNDAASGNPVRNRAPAWAPDNSHIAFSSNRQSRFDKWYAQPTDVFLIRPDGTGREQLTQTVYSDQLL